MYPKELFRPGTYRVVWSSEEHSQAKLEGWLDEKPEVNTFSVDSYPSEHTVTVSLPKRFREGWGDEKDPDQESRVESDKSYEASMLQSWNCDGRVESDKSYEASKALIPWNQIPARVAELVNAPKRRGRPPKIQTQGVA